MSGLLTNGMNLAPGPLSGLELAPFDTQNTQGTMPETYAVSVAQLAAYLANIPTQFIGTPDNGTTQTLTAPMVAVANAGKVIHNSTGGSTPSLTMPTAAAIIAAMGTAFVVNSGYVLRVINANSGTATLVTNTGITTTGTLTVATGTWREFLIVCTSLSANTVTMTSIGTGTNS